MSDNIERKTYSVGGRDVGQIVRDPKTGIRNYSAEIIRLNLRLKDAPPAEVDEIVRQIANAELHRDIEREALRPAATEQAATEPTAGAGEPRTELWAPATVIVQRINRLTGMDRDWGSFWKGFCATYGVLTKPGTKKDGGETTSRREVEFHSLIQAVCQHSDVVDKAIGVEQVHRNAVADRLKKQHIDEVVRDLTDDIREGK